VHVRRLCGLLSNYFDHFCYQLLGLLWRYRLQCFDTAGWTARRASGL